MSARSLFNLLASLTRLPVLKVPKVPTRELPDVVAVAVDVAEVVVLVEAQELLYVTKH